MTVILPASSSTLTVTIFDKKHLFEHDRIYGPCDTRLFDDHTKWLMTGLLKRHDHGKNNEDHYLKGKAAFEPDVMFSFGVKVDEKNWFYMLSIKGKMWNDGHIDAIFY